MMKIALFICVAILLATLLRARIMAYIQPNTDDGLTEIGAKISVLVMDVPHRTSAELHADVKNGTAFLLLWVDDEHGTKHAYSFNTMASLVRLEENKVGLLEVDDPTFKDLCVAKYDPETKKLLYVPMTTENILLIEANRDYLIGEILSDPHSFQKPAGEVVFANGERRELRMIRMPENTIENASLEAVSELHILQKEKTIK